MSLLSIVFRLFFRLALFCVGFVLRCVNFVGVDDVGFQLDLYPPILCFSYSIQFGEPRSIFLFLN